MLVVCCCSDGLLDWVGNGENVLGTRIEEEFDSTAVAATDDVCLLLLLLLFVGWGVCWVNDCCWVLVTDGWAVVEVELGAGINF